MNVTFIGGGNIASAIVGGLLRKRWPRRAIQVVEVAPAARARLARAFKVRVAPALDARAAASDCIILAVKPQQLPEAARALRPLLARQLVITVAAGVRVRDLSRWLGGYPRIVRVMPNTPALALAGISGLYAGRAVNAAGRAAAQRILGVVGTTIWFGREDDLDVVTAVSGSGPAYVYYFVEALESAARELGLAADTAHRLALETFSGALALAAHAGEPPARLRDRVTSRGGTTERGIASLEADRVKDAIVRAVKAAARRSRELGEELGRN